MVEPLKRPWSPISTASDTAVRADRAKAGQTPGGGGGARRRRGRPAMASSSRSRRAVACTTVPAGRASSGAPAHWAPCRSRGRGGHAAARRRGSGFRAPGAVIDDPAAQQHLGQAVAGPQSGRRGHPGRERTRSRAPSWQAGGDPHHGRYRRCAPGGPAGSRTVRSVQARSPLGRPGLEGSATWQATPLLGQGPGPARNRSDRPHSVALTSPCPARRPATSAMTSPASLGIVLSISPHPSACRSPRP